MPHRPRAQQPPKRPLACPAAQLGAFIVVAGLLAGSPRALAASGVAQEYAVKAAFLVNFSDFVEWPSEMTKEGDRITIGVVGRDPFGETLDAIVSAKNAGGERYVIRRYQSAEEIERCHILFVSPRDEESIQKILRSLQEQPTLTVGEADAFARCGGIINFFVEQEKVRFEINQASAEKANLKISSKLLRLQAKATR